MYEVGKAYPLLTLAVVELGRGDGKRLEADPFKISISGMKVNEDNVRDALVELSAFCAAVARKMYSAKDKEEGDPEDLSAEEWLLDVHLRALARWGSEGDSLLGDIRIAEPPPEEQRIIG